MGFLQVILQGSGNLRSPTFYVVGHFVEPFAIVVVLELAEWLHRLFQVVIDNSEAVLAGFKSFPTGKLECLAVVYKIQTLLQDVCTTHWCKGVKIDTYNEVGIIGKECSQLVVDVLFVEVQLVELCKSKIEFTILVVVNSSCVLRIINRAVGLNHGCTFEHVGRLVVFCDGNIEVAHDAFVLLELQVCPLTVVDELFECLF